MSPRTCEVCGGEEFSPLYAKDEHQFFRCRRCRLIRIDPQPTDEVLAGIYGGKYYDAWGGQTDAQRVFDLKKKTFSTHVLANLGLPPGARVLDCGAAFGALMAAARDEGWEPYGIELAAEAAGEIERNFGTGRVYSGPFEQAVFPGLGDAAFDAVFMCDFIEHVRHPLGVIQKAASLLKPGGHLVITTPDGDSWSCNLMGKSWPHVKVEHLFFFSRKNIARLLTQAGLTVTHSGRAHKVLDLTYIQHQFNTYSRAVVTPAVNLVARLAGSRFCGQPRSFSFGEMKVSAVKK